MTSILTSGDFFDTRTFEPVAHADTDGGSVIVLRLDPEFVVASRAAGDREARCECVFPFGENPGLAYAAALAEMGRLAVIWTSFDMPEPVRPA